MQARLASAMQAIGNDAPSPINVLIGKYAGMMMRTPPSDEKILEGAAYIAALLQGIVTGELPAESEPVALSVVANDG